MSLFDRAPNVLYNYTDQILDPRVYSAKNLWRRNDIRDDYCLLYTSDAADE